MRLPGTAQDGLFLSLVVLLSLVLYVRGLGFYSDDWWILEYLSRSADQSLTGLYQTLYAEIPSARMRPVQLLHYAGLYWLFGFHPLGYHLVNAATLMAGTVLMYLVLRELGQSRLVTLAVPLVYALLPHYSTDRFWFASFMANLSMALYFLSLYADLRTLRARRARLWGWKSLSLLSLLGSTLAYEMFLPLFFFNSLLVWYRKRQLDGFVPSRPLSPAKSAVLFGSNLLALLLVGVFKALLVTRTDKPFGIEGHLAWFARLVTDAVIVSYGDYGLDLPRVIARILRDYFPDSSVFAVAGVLGLIVWGYLDRAASQSPVDLLNRTVLLRLIAGGLIVFGLGYVVFLTNVNAGVTATGIGNRIAIAAAVGVAVSLVGILGWVSTFLPSERWRKRSFCVLVALLCTSGFLINNTLAALWVKAYRQERAILTDIRRQFPTLPAGSTLILDGICPYIGPAIVFESSFDLAAALRILYRDPTLRAHVVTPNLKVKEDGIHTHLYAFKSRSLYVEKPFIYHFGHKRTYPLTDAKAARRYFQTFNPDCSSGCPRGLEGVGVSILVTNNGMPLAVTLVVVTLVLSLQALTKKASAMVRRN